MRVRVRNDPSWERSSVDLGPASATANHSLLGFAASGFHVSLPGPGRKAEAAEETLELAQFIEDDPQAGKRIKQYARLVLSCGSVTGAAERLDVEPIRIRQVLLLYRKRKAA